MDVVTSITKARERGATDEMILQEIARQNPAKASQFQEATNRGANPTLILGEVIKQNTAAAPKEEKGTIRTGLEAGIEAVTNLPGSFLNFAGGIASAALSPIQTIKGLFNVAKGAGSKLIPGEQPSEQYFNAVVDMYKDRYGSLQAAEKTARTDPFGFGADVLGLVTGLAGVAGKSSSVAGAVNKASKVTGIERAVPAVQQALQKSTFKLSPAQASKMGENVGQAADWLTKNKVIGTAQSRFSKVDDILEGYENTLQSSLAKSAATVPKQALIQSFDELKSSAQFADDADLLQIQRQVDQAIARLNAFPDQIPAQRLNAYKRSLAKNAFNKAGDKVSDAVEFALSDRVYDELVKALEGSGTKVGGKDLKLFNQDYRSAINAKKILDITKNRSNVGLVGKLTSSGLGFYLGSLINPAFGPIIGSSVGSATAQGLTGTLNVGKTIAAPALGVTVPQAIVPAAAVTNQAANIDDYFNQLGL